MPIDISWHIENRVINIVATGKLDAESITEFNQTMFKLVSNGVAPVHIIANTTDMEQYPTNLATLRQSQTYLSHPNIGWIIVVNSNRLVSFLANILTTVVKVNSRTVASYEEALQILARLDLTLAQA
jgi:hypothetical protein